jgi:hypothetical protein
MSAGRFGHSRSVGTGFDELHRTGRVLAQPCREDASCRATAEAAEAGLLHSADVKACAATLLACFQGALVLAKPRNDPGVVEEVGLMAVRMLNVPCCVLTGCASVWMPQASSSTPRVVASSFSRPSSHPDR